MPPLVPGTQDQPREAKPAQASVPGRATGAREEPRESKPAPQPRPARVEPVSTEPREGKQCLRLRIKAKDPLHAPAALERTFLAVHTPAVQLPPGTLVRITGWVCLPAPIASTDGALVYDSAGGEPLALRQVASLPKWRQFTLYRKVPATGSINVTLALTGIGTAYFDDVHIEALQATQNTVAAPTR